MFSKNDFMALSRSDIQAFGTRRETEVLCRVSLEKTSRRGRTCSILDRHWKYQGCKLFE